MKESVPCFEEEIKWLYLGETESSPSLLRRAIDVAEEAIERSEKESGPKDGLRRFSKGAIKPLRRQLDALGKFLD